jgi:hypothetical protein
MKSPGQQCLQLDIPCPHGLEHTPQGLPIRQHQRVPQIAALDAQPVAGDRKNFRTGRGHAQSPAVHAHTDAKIIFGPKIPTVQAVPIDPQINAARSLARKGPDHEHPLRLVLEGIGSDNKKVIPGLTVTDLPPGALGGLEGHPGSEQSD